jgi:hypothetical protein
MAGNKLSLNKSIQARLTLSKEQEKQITAMYSNLVKKVQNEQKLLSKDSSVSASVNRSRLKGLEQQLSTELNKIGKQLEPTIKDGMTKTAEAVVKDNVEYAKSLGVFEIKGAFSHVPGEVVKSVATGKVYEGNWSLSKAIWSDIGKTQADISSVISQGIALNKSSYDIAKDLEKYVDPSAKKDWSWSKVYPGTAKKVDYNAQRLSRTLVGHAYQQALVVTLKPNPFCTGIKWMASNSGRVCQLCADRDGQIYTPDDLPMDHPNGMCAWRAVMKEEIGEDLANWVNSPAGTYPDIDNYAEFLAGGR